MRSRLLGKLLGINVLIIAAVILAMWYAIDYLAADYFMTLMKDYNISPTEVHKMFVDATHRALIWASAVALGLAIILSFLLTKKVLTPLSQMIGISRRIASGDYSEQVQTSARDEVGQLAIAFNHMAQSLQTLEQLRKTLVIDVAHELRTPLTNMRGYIEALRDGVIPPSEETIESLHDETLRLARLVEDLLQLARAEASRGDLHRQGVDLQDAVNRGLELFRSMLAAKRISVETNLPRAESQLMADPEKLSQVVRNLVQNASQYTQEGGWVKVYSERSPGSIKIVFANSGEGIAQKDLPFIFERFYRGEKSRSREHGGAGIGLAIVKELIEAHGGRVGADSGPTETRIWFTLPA
ncbi:MAG: HAMP domain-containing protein [Deltaproteobacteria bacterium]|nr:HAMP domain-containing protein [Deltaproteobacteria bacterium]